MTNCLLISDFGSAIVCVVCVVCVCVACVVSCLLCALCCVVLCVVCCLLCVVCCVLNVVCCVSCVVCSLCCVLCITCCVLRVVCCVLCVLCWVLCVMCQLCAGCCVMLCVVYWAWGVMFEYYLFVSYVIVCNRVLTCCTLGVVLCVACCAVQETVFLAKWKHIGVFDFLVCSSFTISRFFRFLEDLIFRFSMFVDFEIFGIVSCLF
jgi:hypothetical protein